MQQDLVVCSSRREKNKRMKLLERESGYYEVDPARIFTSQVALSKSEIERFPQSIVYARQTALWQASRYLKQSSDVYDPLGIEELLIHDILYLRHYYAMRGYYHFVESKI